ncbi:hypothetical protein mRhiFer1_008667 [Rhinolophus ferrumequinum]|uniref:Small ribosomal subunit protein eS6 n=1 Tax=Rhinolophus ferrumequinum TaxID=59479 RepID=A0A7J7U148_RHIFE|nr:hypothetical protein mRhiFer1_008667 [Rhinolophus ferrumequinum]
MKLNISFPATGRQKLIDLDDERKLCTFFEERMVTEVAADILGGRMEEEDDVHLYVVRKPLNKEGEKPSTKAPKIQRLVTPHVLQLKRQRIVLKKQCTKKNKEGDTEYVQLLAKRMKKAKEKCQEKIAKRHRLSSLRASISESSKNEIV